MKNLYAKWSKSKTNTVWYHLYVESKKIQQTSEYNKKEVDSATENKPMVTSGGVGEQHTARGLRGTNYKV